ncbi:MAG: hypothetical protein IJB27_04060 [Clostridia bacterium]|nr:hypothetical protein [Clostridia bacterium]
MKKVRKSKRVLSLVLSAVLLMGGVVFEGASTAMAASEFDYTFNTGDARAVLMSVLTGQEADTKLGSLSDRNTDNRINTTDVRMMLNEIIAGTNTVTLVNNAFRLSTISDVTDSSATRTYTVYAPYTDTYTLKCSNASSITIYRGDTLVASGTTTVNASLTEGTGYKLTVKTRTANASFEMSCVANNHQVTLPYDVAKPADISGISLDNSGGYTIASSDLNYQKREGGTYIYCNNPEQIMSTSVGKAFMRDKGLTGDVFMTFEHTNFSNQSVYFGYQVLNETDHDVYVTVTNVGYQTSGSWYGQKAWYDFYNTSFDLIPENTYDNADYLFESYTPRVFQPITYRLPAGQYFYVVGGTSSDAYRNINVDGTANKYVYNSGCANAAVKFSVTGGEVTGTMYCYRRTSQVAAKPAEMGYRCDTNTRTGESYGLQYQGTADHHGVIDSYLSWTFNDSIGGGMLPVSYTTSYASPANIQATGAYGLYDNKDHTYSRRFDWQTHINQQDVNTAVGTDLVGFRCRDANGVERLVDSYHADGTGNFGNFGNWMIEYQEHFSFVNQGNKTRTITLNYMDNGAMLMMPRDSQTGEVLEAKLPVGGSQTGYNYSYSITIPPHSSKQITMTYLLLPMSAGTVTHSAVIA